MKKITFFSMSIAIIMVFSFQSFAQTIEFSDDFENGTTNWDLTGDWGLTDTQSYSPSNSMTDSPGGDYGANLDTYCTMATGIDLSDPAILSAGVKFWAIYDIENSVDFDWVKVLASDDDFATSAEIGIFNGEGNLDPWIEYEYSLGAYIGSSDVKVRIHFHSDGGYEVDGIYIDDFSVFSSDVDDAAPYIGYDNPPTFYEGTLGNYVFVTQLIDASGIAIAVANYQVEDGDWQTVDGVNIDGNDYEFTIPLQEPGSMVVFNIEATDASSNSNVATSADYTYIAGEYMYYDDPEVAFYTTMLAGDGAAVLFTLDYHTQLVTGLIRNYQDSSNPPNKNFMFHVWSGGANGPEDDIITPFEVVPAATPENPNPMTVVDLRDYADDLGMIPGNVYIGLTVPEDTVKITMADMLTEGSFTLVDGFWEPAAYDFHFRLITTGGAVGTEEISTEGLEKIIMFPNPATDFLYIDSKNEILNIQVINAAGQLVYSENTNLLKAKLDVNTLETGMYIVHVKTINGISTQKIIIK